MQAASNGQTAIVADAPGSRGCSSRSISQPERPRLQPKNDARITTKS